MSNLLERQKVYKNLMSTYGLKVFLKLKFGFQMFQSKIKDLQMEIRLKLNSLKSENQ